jgi:hypothetical protein
LNLEKLGSAEDGFRGKFDLQMHRLKDRSQRPDSENPHGDLHDRKSWPPVLSFARLNQSCAQLR